MAEIYDSYNISVSNDADEILGSTIDAPLYLLVPFAQYYPLDTQQKWKL